MANEVNPADKERVDQLLAQQDDVIGQLESLEAEILAAVEAISTERTADNEVDQSAQSSSDSVVVPMTPSGPAAIPVSDSQQRAA